ncbi:MAG TPA: DUF1800 domain-containing protein [Planctomycetia bacterium]|nr:DUF1800 domain-containing protein [Planctomycetia bacterium]
MSESPQPNLAALAGAKGWKLADAAHLLRRAGFGGGPSEIAAAHAAGLEATLTRIFSPPAESDEFASADRSLRSAAIGANDPKQLKAWWLYRMRHSTAPLAEKLALLWHNHFATSIEKVRKTELMARQNDLFRRNGAGSFRDLLQAVAKDPAMLLWLDGNDNRKRAANENFAREVMELFSLGIGNYSEKDIREAAKSFTGWHVRDDEFWLEEGQHDRGPKTIFGKTGRFSGEDAIDLCVAQPACARFIALKLLRGFATDRPTPDAIAAIAALLKRNDYHVGRTLRTLLASEYFFGPTCRGAIVKGPVDFAIGALRALEVNPNFNRVVELLASLGQDVFQPSTVKGWDGGRQWIGAATLLVRTQFAAALLGGESYGVTPDPSATLAKMQGTGASESLPAWESCLLARPLDADRRTAANAFLTKIPREEDRERAALHLLLTAPEFQLL